MQTFTTYRAVAERLAPALNQKADDDWKMITDDEKFDISDGYDLVRIDNLYSLYRKVRMLAGTDWKTRHPGVTLDRIQITRWQPDTCGCITTFTWDRAAPEESRDVHPHEGERYCRSHEHMKGNSTSHCHELWAENRHKNHTVSELAESMKDKYMRDNRAELNAELVMLRHESDDPSLTLEAVALSRLKSKIKFKHVKDNAGNRVLAVSHPDLADLKVRGEASLRIANHPDASKRAVRISHED